MKSGPPEKFPKILVSLFANLPLNIHCILLDVKHLRAWYGSKTNYWVGDASFLAHLLNPPKLGDYLFN